MRKHERTDEQTDKETDKLPDRDNTETEKVRNKHKDKQRQTDAARTLDMQRGRQAYAESDLNHQEDVTAWSGSLSVPRWPCPFQGSGQRRGFSLLLLGET